MAIEYADIAPHIALTDQQIRDALNADMRLVRDAQIQPLQRMMVRSGMVRSVGFAGATGIIAGLYDTFNDEGKRIADEFLVALVSPFPYPCSQPAEGTVLVQVNTIANANAGQLLNGYTAQSFTAELTAITGGRKYGTVTTQQVTDVRAAEAARVDRETLVTDYESALGEHVDIHTMTRAEVVTGMRAAADQVEGV